MRRATRGVLVRRGLLGVLAAAALTTGLLGAYGYGEAYSLHRGFAPVVRLARAGTGRMVSVHFYSRALHKRTDYLVYLPPGYSPRRHYPVYYLLHGAPGAPNAFTTIVNLDVRLANRLSERQLRPMILVMPDGRIDGNTFSDGEWANTPSAHIESYVIDVVRDVDHRFATIANRQDRVIAGYSAGAYGAINIALHQLATFGNVQVWSGYFRQTHTGVFAHAGRAAMAYNSPLQYVRTLAGAIAAHPLRVYMFIGRRDPDEPQIVPMDHALLATGALATYDIFPGGHDWSVWYSRVDMLLTLASRMVSQPLPAPSVAVAHHARPRHRRAASVPHARRARGPAVNPAGALPAATPPRIVQSAAAGRPPGLRAADWLGLALALVSAALINFGFLLQHRGLARAGGLRRAVRNPAWLAGQGLGWAGFALQILAVALAPLSLVQAFAAGGLALSVPLAAVLMAQPITRRQVLGVLSTAAALAVLALGVPGTSARPPATSMALAGAAVAAVAAVVALRRGPVPRALAAGLFYGVADAAIKADAVGSGALVSGWTVAVALATLAGFIAFQSALREGEAVSAIALMTALTALTALGFGVGAFGESLGSGGVVTAAHVLAVAVVLACVPVLAGATRPGGGPMGPTRGRDRARRALVTVGGGAYAAMLLVAVLLAGTGLLYLLRGQSWLAGGARIGDALPLLQLAGGDRQALSLVIVSWLGAGLVLGVGLLRTAPWRRVVLVALPGLALMLLASEASYALARNDRLSAVLGHRVPGLGAWLEVALLALGAWLPRRGGWGMRRLSGSLMPRSELTCPPSRSMAGSGARVYSGS